MTAPADALRVVMGLVAAVEAEYCGPATEANEPDDSKVSYPEDKCHITFGHIRRARKALPAIAEALADARRYRWLRDEAPDTWDVSEWIDNDTQEIHMQDYLDAAIDAAIATTEQAAGGIVRDGGE